MASLLKVSQALARHASARARALPAAFGAVSTQFAVSPASFSNADGQRATITSTRILSKRRGGNSAFVTKAPKFQGPRSGPFKKKNALKADTAPHKTHVDRIRELKALGQENERNAAQWEELEADAELNAELDNVYEYLKNLGPEGEYIYRPDPTLADLDETQVLAKLNALARGDATVVAEVEQRLQEETDSMAKQPHELSVDDYNFLMRVYAEKGLHDHANALLTRMEKNLPSYIAPVIPAPTETAPTDSVVATDADSLDNVSHVVAPDSKTYMYYVVSLVKAGAIGPSAAVRTLGRMKERGIEPSIHVYNSVMNVCAKAGKVQWAYNIFEKMQIAGLTPDRASFTILMHAAIAEGEVDKAFETFHLMRAHVTDPDVVSFTVLIHGYAKIGRIERAINLYEDLLECGLTPSHITFNVLILACAKSHYYAHKAIEFYHEMQELYDYHPDLFTYNNVLHACSKQGDYIQAERVWHQMLKHQVPIASHGYNTLLHVYARAQIKKVVAQAPRNKAPLPPAEEIYQAPFEYDDDGREIDLTRPFKEVSSMKNWNYDGSFDEDDDDDDDDDEEYGEYEDDESMEAARDSGLSDEERAALDAIRAHDQKQYSLVPNMEPLTDDELDNTPMDLRSFGKFQTQIILRAEKKYDEMIKEREIAPTVVTLTTMLAVYANALRLGRAEVFFQNEFAKHGIQPNEHTYRVLMQMYVRAHRTEKAETLLAEIKAKIDDGELKPDGITLGMLVDHYARHKKLRKALTLLEEADEWHVRLNERHYKKIRRVTERLGLFTELIPEDPDAVITAGTRAKLKEKRKVRSQVIAFNQKVGKKFLLPASVAE